MGRRTGIFVAIPRVCEFDQVWKGTIVNRVEAVYTGVSSACVGSFSLESFQPLVASVEGERTRRPFASLALRRKIMTCVEAPTVVGFEKTLSLLPILRGAPFSVASARIGESPRIILCNPQGAHSLPLNVRV